MGLVMNTTNEVQKTKVFGNYFEFKPGQIKSLEDRISHFIVTERRTQGFVGLPEEFSDPSFAATEDGKKVLAFKKKEGLESYLQSLRERVNNVEVSLRRDLEQKNIKADPRVFASDGEIEAYELLAAYQKGQNDEAEKKLKRLEELEKKIKGA